VPYRFCIADEEQAMTSKPICALRAALAVVYLAVGTLNLAGTELAVQQFEVIGFGQWFRVLTGALEIAGGLSLLIPMAAGFGALLLLCVMLGAAIARLTVLDGSALPAAVLLMLNAFIAWSWLRDATAELPEDSLDDDLTTLLQ
jgi:hypothetical protein